MPIPWWLSLGAGLGTAGYGMWQAGKAEKELEKAAKERRAEFERLITRQETAYPAPPRYELTEAERQAILGGTRARIAETEKEAWRDIIKRYAAQGMLPTTLPAATMGRVYEAGTEELGKTERELALKEAEYTRLTQQAQYQAELTKQAEIDKLLLLAAGYDYETATKMAEAKLQMAQSIAGIGGEWLGTALAGVTLPEKPTTTPTRLYPTGNLEIPTGGLSVAELGDYRRRIQELLKSQYAPSSILKQYPYSIAPGYRV